MINLPQNSPNPLEKSTVVVIFASAPTGLGHLRVTNTLYAGLTPKATTVLLGSHDRSLQTIHKFISIHPIAREFMEWIQRGNPQKVFTRLYRWYLRNHKFNLYRLYIQMETILEQRISLPEEVIVVATHFGLAHQLAAIKQKLETKKSINR